MAVLDLKKSVVSLKADERMIAFVGFVVRLDEQAGEREGVLKISAFYRADGSGYLTLTFIVDTQEDASVKLRLQNIFSHLTENALRSRLGSTLEMMVKVPLASMSDIPDWYLDECSIYLKVLKGRERILVHKDLLPAMSSVLPCSFSDVQWWGDDLKQALDGATDGQAGSRSLLRKWFQV